MRFVLVSCELRRIVWVVMHALQNELPCGAKRQGDNGGVVTEDALRIAMGMNVMDYSIFL